MVNRGMPPCSSAQFAMLVAAALRGIVKTHSARHHSNIDTFLTVIGFGFSASMQLAVLESSQYLLSALNNLDMLEL